MISSLESSLPVISLTGLRIAIINKANLSSRVMVPFCMIFYQTFKALGNYMLARKWSSTFKVQSLLLSSTDLLPKELLLTQKGNLLQGWLSVRKSNHKAKFSATSIKRFSTFTLAPLDLSSLTKWTPMTSIQELCAERWTNSNVRSLVGSITKTLAPSDIHRTVILLQVPLMVHAVHQHATVLNSYIKPYF